MSTMTTVLVVVLVCLLVSLVTAADLPITRVALFSSGVGYFEREGKVQGDATIELSFRTAQINDILKSLVVQDLGGGTVAPVTYAPQDPLERTLGSFAVNIADNPRLGELWNRIRGTSVMVTGQQVYQGTVYGMEKQERAVDDKVMTYEVLNLLTDQGLVQIPLYQVSNITLLDPKLDGDLRKAFEAIDQARDVDKRPVTLSFKGQGEREVMVGYLLETPVWKTSYRLLTDENGLFIQGWAIVENTTDEDWNAVSLSLVSGQPVSFVQTLYDPLYVQRVVIPPSVQAAARPRVWEGAMEQQKMAEAEMAPPEAPPAAAPPAPALRARRAADRGAAPAGMGMATAGAEMDKLSLADAGVAAMAAGSKVGTLFQYAINQPVTIPRKRSAMLPIINDKIEGEKLSIYNASVDAKHPMNGIKLKNSSPLHLMGGAVTVFDGGVYGGDALIEDIPPGDERVMTYAVDLAVEVEPQSKSAPQELVAAKIVHGVLTLTHKQRMETTYVVKNRAEQPRTVLVEHPVRPDWTLVEPKEPAERTRANYRFRLLVEPGKTEKLTVVEEWPTVEIVRLADRGLDQLKTIIIQPQLSPELKAALQKAADILAELAVLQAQREEAEARIQEIEAEQTRIRQNMRELDRTSELYKQYVQKLAQQEQEFETLREQVRTLREQEAAKSQELADYLAGLDVG